MAEPVIERYTSPPASAAAIHCMRALIDVGVDVNALNSVRQSALYLALKSDKPQVDTVPT